MKPQVNVITAGKGQSVDSYYAKDGVKTNRPTANEHFGVPAQAMFPSPTEYTQCQAIKKTGEACTAPPVKTRSLCIGHLRQQEKLISDADNADSGS